MDAMDVNAWILLSVGAAESGSLRDIIRAADDLNHAPPTLEELQTGLGWLRAQGAILRQGDRFVLTAQGRTALEAPPQESKFDTWDVVAASLSLCPHVAFEPESLDPEEVRRAMDGYAREFRKAYNELRKSDR